MEETNTQTIVVALGGNALQRGNEASAAAQERVAAETARQLINIVKAGHRLILTHGNGPQVGAIVLHEEAINTESVPTMPLDSDGAMSQGLIGYWLQQALVNELRAQGIDTSVATIVVQTLVSADDPAFEHPSKPIGPFYKTEEEARAIAEQRGFSIVEDAGRGWRRVVPSPKPQRIIEEAAIRTLVDGGCLVVTGGGGGVPVVEKDGTYVGVEAVIDKDFSAALLADQLGADQLIILTAVETASIRYGQPDEQQIHTVDPATMQGYIEQGYFAPGSMLPKVQAALNFASKPGRRAVIASLDHVSEAIAGEAGTIIAT